MLAEEICSGYKSDIAIDHQWEESQFTKEDAIKGLKRLELAINGKIDMDWMESKNWYTKIEGYRLKSRYERLKKEKSSSKSYIESYKDEFCRYIKSVPIVD